MPHLSLPVGPGGPTLEILIGVSIPRSDALRKANQPVPQPIKITALIDTGASSSCVCSSVLKQLNAPCTGTIPIHTPSTQANQPHSANQYDVSIIIQHPWLTRTFMAVPVIESQLAHQGIHALIGRDILASCFLTYDGQAKNFILGF